MRPSPLLRYAAGVILIPIEAASSVEFYDRRRQREVREGLRLL